MCPDGIPTQDGVPLEWVALWENPHMMGVEGMSDCHVTAALWT